MGFAKKMEWFKWIRKYSTGILDSKTSSMETLIDSSSSKTINNYAYASSVVADDEFINVTSADVAAPQHQRPMLPPPTTSQDSPSPPPPQLPNDVYDCCVSLDGMPIKHEFQYTLTDVDRCGNIPKRDIEGLASKILESVYGTTMEFSPSRGQRTIKVTLNVCKQSATADGCTTPSWSGQPHRSGRDRKHRSSKNDRLRGRPNAADTAETAAAYVATALEDAGFPLYGEVRESPHYTKPRAKWYRREQLIEMVQRSLAENLSFQSLRKSILEKSEGHHRTRTKRRGHQSKNVVVGTMQAIPLPPVPVAKSKPCPKVAWSPYDFEPVAHIPSHHHHEQIKNIRSQRRSHGNGAVVVGGEHARAVKSSGRHQRHQQHKQQHHQHQHRRTAAVVVSGGVGDLQQSKDVLEQTKNDDHQRYKRAKLASKKIHHHIHEHHHYHHYDYYIV